MAPGGGGGSRKRPRAESTARLSSDPDPDPDPDPDETLAENSRPPTPLPSFAPFAPFAGGLNDPTTADVLLHLHLDDSSPPSSPAPQPTCLDLHLHSFALRRSRYLAALLFGRWFPDASDSTDAVSRLKLTVPSAAARSRGPFESTLPSSAFSTHSILSAADALKMLPIALELLFDDCIQACARLVPFLEEEQSRDLLSRIRPETSTDGNSHRGGCFTA